MASLFAKPQQPQVTPPTPMPDSSSPAVLEAQKKAAAEATARAGRMSTILTDSAGPAANARNVDTYTAKTLGGGG